MAVAGAGLATLAVAFAQPRQLMVSTDVIGYPIYANFNVERQITLYYLGVGFFPVCALLLYLALTWLGGRDERPSVHAQDATATEPLAVDQHIRLTAAVRALAVGVTFAVEVAIVAGASPRNFWVTIAAVAAIYAGLVAGAALISHRVTVMGQANALLSPLALLGLLGVSASTTVTVVSDNSVHHYDWAPWWVVVPLTAGVLGWIWKRMSSARTDEAVRALERRAMLFVSVPVLLLLLLSRFEGALGPIEVFHEGEGLVGAKLTSAGYFYWRDLISTHGILQDVVMPWLGLHLLEDSRWGHATANLLLLEPLTFVSLYLLGAWLFEKSWAFVVTLVVLILSLQFLVVDTRFILWPLILLLLGVALQSGRGSTSVLLGVCLVTQAILVPESAYCIPACGVVVILYDVYYRRRGANLLETFSRTLWVAGGGVALFAVFSLYLLSQHALGDFFFYYLIFVPGHELVGGLPLHPGAFGRLVLFFVVAPPAAILIGFAYFAARVIRKQPLETRDWVVAASGLFALPYYTKFLDRADIGHAYQAYGAAIPLILFLIYRACTYFDALARGTHMSRFGQPVAILVLVGALASVLTNNAFHTEPALGTWLASTPSRFHQTAPTLPELARVGYSDDAVDTSIVPDLQRVFNGYLRPGDWVFDFSNQPALIYYLVDQSPHVRYYNVTMASTERAQKDLVAELRRDPPKLIVFSDEKYGLPSWDGIPNTVRHYEVSQYILDNYTPLLSTHAEIVYGRTSAQLSPADAQGLALQQPVVTSDLAFKGFPCDWGYAPNFLFISPPPPTRATSPVTLITTADPDGVVTFEGWAGDLSTGGSAHEVIATVGDKTVATAAPSLDKPVEAAAVGRPGFATSGFRLAIDVPDRMVSDLSSIRIFGVSAQGVASELASSPGAGKPVVQINRGDGTVIPVRPGEVMGTVESIIASHQLVVMPPPGSGWSDYRWLEITSASRFGEDRWALYDQSGDPGRQVIFRTLGGTSTIRVYVGSCAQWHGYGSMPLFLAHRGGQEIRSVRLLP